MLIYYLKIVRHPTVSDSKRLKNATPKKKWLPTLFRSRGNRRKSQGQNGAHIRTAARMSCRLTLFRMALFSFPYVTCSVAPVAPVAPAAPAAPVAPWGMVKSSTAASGVPVFVTVACVPGCAVVTVPTVTVAAAPAAPVAQVRYGNTPHKHRSHLSGLTRRLHQELPHRSPRGRGKCIRFVKFYPIGKKALTKRERAR